MYEGISSPPPPNAKPSPARSGRRCRASLATSSLMSRSVRCTKCCGSLKWMPLRPARWSGATRRRTAAWWSPYGMTTFRSRGKRRSSITFRSINGRGQGVQPGRADQLAESVGRFVGKNVRALLLRHEWDKNDAQYAKSNAVDQRTLWVERLSESKLLLWRGGKK